MDRPLSAWLYCRIDAPEDVYGVLKKQKKELYDYADQKGFTVAGTVYSLSCIGRDICRTMACLEQLRQSGVAVYSPLEGALLFSFQKTMQDVISHSGFQQRSEGD